MTRLSGILSLLFAPLLALAQGGDQQVRTKADAFFAETRYAEAIPLYSQLVSLHPSDRQLNYRFGACLLFGGEDKEKSIGHLKFATEDPGIPADAWFWLGRAYHLNYRFKDAQLAYQQYRGVADRKTLTDRRLEDYEQQCRNGQKLLANLKEINVRSKVEVDGSEFFRFYDLSDIGGRIVVTPDELKTALDRKNKLRSLVHLPERGGPIYYASYGKDGKTGLDIYRTVLLPDGRFDAPIKLAGYINTDQDDDYAFMHPDGRSFYFSSKGHNSMGGYDVFRAPYDKMLDTFGRPVNLDFAVNTPDDDIFYLVDADHKEACFASGRSSRQGKLHVYRVGTEQVPLMITVLKGTYANEFDAKDRKARIIVEDAVTREQVSEVRTDMNGSYVLALPRSGKFRFMVECGPSGRTHVGQVDIPRADGPRGYRQELSLIRQGEQEKLMIRNYFDVPLEDDLIELAMDEIKRRARLDVSETPATIAAQQPAPLPKGDLMTNAGFPGDVTVDQAVTIARGEADELERQANSAEEQSGEAFTLALEWLAEAERMAREAETLVAEAGEASSESGRNELMTQAAQARQRSRQAGVYARAAYLMGMDLAAEANNKRTEATVADRSATDLRNDVQAGRDEQALVQLRALKQQLDTRSGPNAPVDLPERTRRAVTEQERATSRALQQANTKRAEENELADRIVRLEREMNDSRDRSRRTEMERELNGYREQRVYLQREVDVAFDKARAMDRETIVLRGKASLAGHLASNTQRGATTRPEPGQLDIIGQRIDVATRRADAVAIDERYDGSFVEEGEARSYRFDWDLASAGRSTDTQRLAGRNGGLERMPEDGSQQPPGGNDARSNEGRSGSAQGEAPGTKGGSDQRTANDSNQRSNGLDVGGSVESTSADRVTPVDGRTRTSGDLAPTTKGTDGTVDQTTAKLDPASTTGGDAGTNLQKQDDGRANDVIAVTDDTQPRSNAPKQGEVLQDGASDKGDTRNTSVVGSEMPRVDGGVGVAKAADVPSNAASTDRPATDMGIVKPGSSSTELDLADATVIAEERAFLLENQVAEMRQLARTERNKTRRDSLNGRIVEMELEVQRLRAGVSTSASDEKELALQSVTEELGLTSSSSVDLRRAPLVFDQDLADAELERKLFTAYGADKARLDRIPDADERAEALQGLELMMADSIRDEMVRQVAILELDASQADRILPRVARLRQLRADHLAMAERHVAERQAELALMTAASGGQGAEGNSSSVGNGSTGSYMRPSEGHDPVNDHYIAFAPLRKDVYASTVVHRAKDTGDALSAQEADLSRIRVLDGQIDSMLKAMVGMPAGRELDRMRRKSVLLQDERYIQRADLGQRTAYVMRREWSVARDSLTQTERAVTARGLPPSEPVLVMAQDLRVEATRHYDQAAALRKKAERSEDVVLRDSLYREAYASELQALWEIDRSITLYNHLGSDQHVRGEVADHQLIAAKVLGLDEATLAAAAQRKADKQRVQPNDRSLIAPGEQPAATKSSAQGAAPDVPELRSISIEAPVEVTTMEEVVSDDQRSVEPITEVPGVAVQEKPSIIAAREAAHLEARRAEAMLGEDMQRAVKIYEHFLDAEEVVLKPDPRDATGGVQLLGQLKEQMDEQAIARSAEAAQARKRSEQLEQDAANAKRRERTELEQLAARARVTADSLDRAALEKVVEAAALEQRMRDAELYAALRQRLLQYYYLGEEDFTLITNEDDFSRYFQMKSRAMEQADAATGADRAARGNRELASSLARQASTGVAKPTPEAMERARVLTERAAFLRTKADSLDQVSQQLRSAAALNEAQAAQLLQGMEDRRSTELMALEMQSRRSGGSLSRMRDGAGAQPDPIAAAPAPPAPSTLPAATATTKVPARLEGDVFELRPVGQRTGGAISKEGTMPEGIVFKVQIGALRSAIAPETFGDMTPVMAESIGNGITRYTAGLFTTFEKASDAKDLVRGRGYNDAFVVAYRDGKRIPLGEAMRASRGGQEVLAMGEAFDVPAKTPEEVVPINTEPPVPQRTGVTVAIERPSTVAEASEDPAVVLATYPPTVEEIIDRFIPAPDATAYYSVPGAAPARQVETVRGLFFTVQVGVYSRPVPLDKLYNITPLNSELTETAKVRYTTGLFLNEDTARGRRDETVVLGVKDAFITAYLNGKRIPMREARALLAKFGSSILAKP